MVTLSAIHLYPIKSTAGRSQDTAWVGEEGLAGDRRFMVAKPDGTFLTARTHPQLQRAMTTFDGETLTLAHPELPTLHMAVTDFARAAFATTVWADDFQALTTHPRLDAWFSEVAGEPARLLWLGEQSPRYRDSIARRVSFADGYPLMLISEASLADLNTRTDDVHVMAQFRPNLVVAGTEAYAEDAWRRIRIGEVVMRVGKPCSRCAMISVDPATGTFKAGREPLRTLASYRRGEGGKVYFGQNLIAENEGRIMRGAPVEVLEHAL
ncbi:MOSC domain-containing protein [Chromohalobacter israelensis]|uniref:MOSC domain-containing protein n=1 Tax=Chromohalobacter israelensis TaxID=141390 RepID=UPI00265C7AA4|nr:MOSC N-terminal beta barrel domain-containing protein [Chromohalobacter salexigens]MDO0945817.1 MOSC domain-containing protein [Chromohalobacter salexigens]